MNDKLRWLSLGRVLVGAVALGFLADMVVMGLLAVFAAVTWLHIFMLYNGIFWLGFTLILWPLAWRLFGRVSSGN